MTWSIKEKQQAGRKEKKVFGKATEYIKKGNIEPVPSEDLLKRLVSEGSGKEVECPAAIKTEREEYRKAQDQSKLLENLKRAVLDSDIESLNNTNQLLPT